MLAIWEASDGPMGLSGAHLTMFDNFMKNHENYKIASMPFSYNFEPMCNITLVLYVFLRSHVEAILHSIAYVRLLTIHLSWKLQCIFNDFDIFINHKEVAVVAQSRCASIQMIRI